jgi:5-methylcytosine-specific restriction endonuclease McrA
MAVPSSAGRTHRRWREQIRPAVLERSRVCWWCGHGGANAVDHVIPKVLRPDLAHDPDNLLPIHGTEGCPICPHRKGKPRRCNGEKKDKVGPPPEPGSRLW